MSCTISFKIPPLADTFIFRRDFLASIRKAVGKAQIDGEIAGAVAVECFKALPIAEPTPK